MSQTIAVSLLGLGRMGAALVHLARASSGAGVDPYPETTLAYFEKAQALGHGGDEIPAVYEAMRARR